MKIPEILDAWASYADYDPNQTSFDMLSVNYHLNGIAKKVEMLLKWDTSGVIALLYLRQAMKDFYENAKLPLSSILSDPHCCDEHIEMWKTLNCTEALAAEDEFKRMLDSLESAVNPQVRLTGDVEKTESDPYDITAIVDRLTDGLPKLHESVYIRSENPIDFQVKVTNTIHIFDSLRDALADLTDIEDCCALCYIRQPNSSDGYFAVFIKSNGNLVSLDERLAEVYPGQHHNSRNGRYLEKHAFELFPYDEIFEYGEYDYKGYATDYRILEDKLSLTSLTPTMRLTTSIVLMLTQKRFEGRVIEDEPLIIDSLMRANRGLNDPSCTALAVTAPKALAHHDMAESRIAAELSIDCVKSGSCILEFKEAHIPMSFRETEMFGEDMPTDTEKLDFVNLYGDGFVCDYSHLLESDTFALPDPRVPDATRNNEFVVPYVYMKAIAYKQLRQQLADHIKHRMFDDFEKCGGRDAACAMFEEAVQANKEKLFEMAARVWSQNKIIDYNGRGDMRNRIPHNPEGIPGHWQMKPFYSPLSLQYASTPNAYMELSPQQPDYASILLDPMYPNTKANILFDIEFRTSSEIEELFGIELPKPLKLWRNPALHRRYNGNHILDITDPVGDLFCPLESKDINGLHSSAQKHPFSIRIGLSKRGLRKLAKELDLPIPEMTKKFQDG